MRRALGLGLFLIAACGEPEGFTSMDQGVAFAKSRGLELQEPEPIPASGSAIIKGNLYKLRGKSGTLTILQCSSKETAAKYAESKADDPATVYLQNGRVLFGVHGKTAVERNEILIVLQ
jgi:hypothetical protein